MSEKRHIERETKITHKLETYHTENQDANDKSATMGGKTLDFCTKRR